MNHALKLKKTFLMDVGSQVNKLILWFNDGLSNDWVKISVSK